MVTKKIIGRVFFWLLLMGLTGPTWADSDPETVIRYRHNVMKALGGHMGALALIVRGRMDFPNHLTHHAEAVAAISRTVIELFPAGSNSGNSSARSVIWQKWDKFRDTCAGGVRASEEFLSAVKNGDKADVKKKFRVLSKSCARCHRKFRVPRGG